MKSLAIGMRVKVLKDEDEKTINRDGVVTRVCTDGVLGAP